MSRPTPYHAAAALCATARRPSISMAEIHSIQRKHPRATAFTIANMLGACVEDVRRLLNPDGGQ